jgi:hypothetical protein
MVLMHKGNSRTASVMVLGLAALLLLAGCSGGSGPVRETNLGGLFPPVTVTVVHLTDWTVTVTATQQLAEATLYFDNGDAYTSALSGYTAVIHSDLDANLSYLAVRTKGGDYWYFDRGGLWLPKGYTPKFESSLDDDRSASSVWVDGQELAITASDEYNEVKVYYADDSTQVFETSETSGTYNLLISGENVEAIRITLEADSSQHYFAPDGSALPLGTKWYEDAD